MLKYLIAALLALSSTGAFSAAPWLTSYCQNGKCAWTRINEVTKVLTNDRGSLFRVQQQSCVKDYPSGRHPNTYACKPTEISLVEYLAVFCSNGRPVVAHPADNGWLVVHLSFDDENDSHAMHWYNRLYFLVCHNHDIGEEANIVGFDQIARRFGYRAGSRKVPEDTKVRTIEDVAGEAEVR